MKMSSERLQNVPYFWNKKTQIVLITVGNDILLQNLKMLEMKKKKKTFSNFKKYGKFYSISLVNFIKHEPLISEE